MPLRRWQMLGVGLLVQSIGGIMYAYALYSNLLKQQFQLTQEQTDLISTITLVGCNFGVHIGWLYNKGGRSGPLILLLVSLVLGLAGWVPLWALLHFDVSTTLKIASVNLPTFVVILVLAFCQGHAQMALDIATISTLVQNFPEHRGLVISLLKSYVGLSGALVGQVFAAVFKPMDDECGELGANSTTTTTTAASTTSSLAAAGGRGLFDGAAALLSGDHLAALGAAVGDAAVADGGTADPAEDCKGTILFLLYLAAEVLLVCTIGATVIRQTPPADAETQKSHDAVASKLRLCLYGTMVLALVTAGSSFAEYMLSDLGYLAIGFLAAVVLVFLAVMILACTRRDARDGGEEDDDDDYIYDDPSRQRLLTRSINVSSPRSSAYKQDVKNYSLGEAICSPWLWTIFFSFMLGGGSGMVVNANLAQIIPTTEHHPSFDNQPSTVKKTIFVTLFSVCNCFGRLLAGLLGDWLLKHKGIPRPAVFAIGLAMMSVSMALLCVGTYVYLFPAIVLCGLAYGSFNALCPTLISELFGIDHFAKIYAFNSISLAIGSFGMATKMAGTLYGDHPELHHNCTAGTACFRTTFLICAAACGVMCLFMIGLARSTRLRYRKLYPKFFESKAQSVYD